MCLTDIQKADEMQFAVQQRAEHYYAMSFFAHWYKIEGVTVHLFLLYFFIAWHDRLASLSGYLHIYYVPPPPLPQMWWIGINWQAGVHVEYSHLLDIFSARPSPPPRPPPIFRILHKCLSRFKSLKWNNFRNFTSFQTSGPCSAAR